MEQTTNDWLQGIFRARAALTTDQAALNALATDPAQIGKGIDLVLRSMAEGKRRVTGADAATANVVSHPVN